jgi:hypothetical protein
MLAFNQRHIGHIGSIEKEGLQIRKRGDAMRILALRLSRFFFLPLIVTVSSLILLSLSLIKGRASDNSSRQHQQSVSGAKRIGLRALGERPAWLNLDEGRELPFDYNPQSSNNSILHDSNTRALSLASGDFDEDGTADPLNTEEIEVWPENK